MQRDLARSDEVRMAERSKAPDSRKYIFKKNTYSNAIQRNIIVDLVLIAYGKELLNELEEF